MFWDTSVLCIIIQAIVQIEAKLFTNQWVAKIHGGEEVAQRVARDLGYTYKGQAMPFVDHYMMTKDDLPEMSKKSSDHFTRSLKDLKEVKWAEQQFFSKGMESGSNPELHERYKQEDMDELMKLTDEMELATPWDTNKYEGRGSCVANFFRFLFSNGQGNIAKLGTFSTKTSDFVNQTKLKGPTFNVELLSKKQSSYAPLFNDILWKYQWYLQDYRIKEMPVMDHNVVPVYKMGYTGKGVNIAVLDDGVVHDHPDLEDNFDESLSYDFCNEVTGSMPDMWLDNKLRSHGTKCAGVIAMKANNELCGVGIAHDAKIAGFKVICENGVSDFLTGRGLLFQIKKFHIYANSWGGFETPMLPMGPLSKSALATGVNFGRGFKGVIYLFSSGSYNRLRDNCASSAAVNNYATITIASATQRGKVVEYSGRCTAVFATAYSGGNPKEERVVSISPDGECTRAFSGTSASQAIAAGIIALVLEANPNLKYRDVTHLIAMTSEVAPLANNKNTWYKNGRNFWVSSDFGFGLLNAENMVIMAKKWSPLPKKHVCEVYLDLKGLYEFDEEIPSITYNKVDACSNDDFKAIHYLEQFHFTPDINYPYRGALSITITSPEGTKSNILEMRPSDVSNEGLSNWSIKSVQNWGEDPNGVWEIEVKVNHIKKWPTTIGRIEGFSFTFYGTAEMPAHYEKPREYSAFKLPKS